MIKVTIKCCCAACPAEISITHFVRVGDEVPKVHIPYSWNVVNHNLYCPKHTITVVKDDVDEKKII